jgi:hypothetical protein
MEEKTFDAPVQERFEFVLSINGNIICQRYFAIPGFQERSIGSTHLTYAVLSCVNMIERDLREKTDIYNTLTAPQVFNDENEMNRWVKKPTFKLDVPSFVLLRNTEEVFVWDGEKMRPYDKPFNTSDYVGEPDSKCVLKFALLDNGKEVRSVCFDGNKYPKFVRTNIDLSNSKNKFEAEGVYAPYEAFIINKFNKGRVDLIQEIRRKIVYACSREDVQYFSNLRFGDKLYDLNLDAYNDRLFIKEPKQKKKRTK